MRCRFLLKKRQGEELPLYAMLTIGFAVILLFVFLHWINFFHIADSTKDSVTISVQAVCLHDPVVSSLLLEKEDIVFYSGNDSVSMRYYADTEQVTRKACENAYRLFKDILTANLPSGYEKYEIEKFEMLNVLNGIAYTYDSVTGKDSSFVAGNKESSIQVKIKVIRDSFFGKVALPIQETIFLREK